MSTVSGITKSPAERIEGKGLREKKLPVCLNPEKGEEGGAVASSFAEVYPLPHHKRRAFALFCLLSVCTLQDSEYEGGNNEGTRTIQDL